MIELKSWMNYLARDKDGQLNGYNACTIFKDPEFGAWMSVRPGAGGVMGEPIDDDQDLSAIEVHWDNTYPTRIVRNGEKVVLREIVKEEYNYALRQASPPKPLFTHEGPRKHNTDVFDAVRYGFEGLAKGRPDQVRDSIGDMYVVMTILSLQLGLDIDTCIGVAYDEIKDRRVKIVNGVFVKESDLNGGEQ